MAAPVDTRFCRRVCACLCSLFALLGACTGTPPEIVGVRQTVRAVHNAETGSRIEYLSVFAGIVDEDDIRDLDEWILSHTESELSWRLDRDSRPVRRTGDDRLWFGSDSLASPPGEALPRGRYVLRVVDLAGRATDAPIEIRSLDFDVTSVVFPALREEGGAIEISGGRDRTEVRGYDANGDPVYRLSSARAEIPTDGFLSERLPDAVTHHVFTYSERSDVWLSSGPFRLE